MNNNVNLRFDMRANNRGTTTSQEDDEEQYIHQENINIGLTHYIEPSSDENQNTHSNDVVGNGTSYGISHRISQSSGGSYSNLRSSISGTPYGKFQGSEGCDEIYKRPCVNLGFSLSSNVFNILWMK